MTRLKKSNKVYRKEKKAPSDPSDPCSPDDAGSSDVFSLIISFEWSVIRLVFYLFVFCFVFTCDLCHCFICYDEGRRKKKEKEVVKEIKIDAKVQLNTLVDKKKEKQKMLQQKEKDLKNNDDEYVYVLMTP